MDDWELRHFFAVVILMGVDKRPNLELYWSTGWGLCSSIPSIMSRNRFQQIKRYFHIRSNLEGDPRDPFRKVSFFPVAVRIATD